MLYNCVVIHVDAILEECHDMHNNESINNTIKFRNKFDSKHIKNMQKNKLKRDATHDTNGSQIDLW